MDSKTFKEITGLDNYLGFKSILKNSQVFGYDFACSDDTIVFNQVFVSSLSYIWPFTMNQVAVVLSSHGKWKYFDVNAQTQSLAFAGSSGYSVSNLIVGQGFTTLNPSEYCMIAIFDLY